MFKNIFPINYNFWQSGEILPNTVTLRLEIVKSFAETFDDSV